MLHIEGEWITSQYEQRVSDAATYPVMKQYIKEKFKWGEDEFNTIDWDAVVQARKGCTKNENVKITKLMYDWVNTGHQKSKMRMKYARAVELKKKRWSTCINVQVRP